MGGSTEALVIVGIILLVLFLIQLFWRVKAPSTRHEFSHNFAQAVYGTLGAVAIIVAGLLYIVERQWSPRFEVDLRTRTSIAPGSRPRRAIIQSIIAVQNYGRTEQLIKNIELGVDTYSGSDLTTNVYGDVQARNIIKFVRNRENKLMPGELDIIPIEVSVPCTERMVRVLIKVPQPPYEENVEQGKRNVYERKAIVPLNPVCSGRETVTETAFQSSVLALSD